MADEDEGLPLAKAIRVYGDPELVAVYDRACARVSSIPPPPSWIGGSPRAHMEWANRYEGAKPAAQADVRRAWKVLVADFMERLQSGKLTAMGMKVPFDEDSQPIAIARHLWLEWGTDFRRSRVKANGLEFANVRVFRADPTPGRAHEFFPPAPPIESPPAEQVEPSRGRPSIKEDLAAEMRRRAQRGGLHDTITSECRALRAWAEKNLQGEQIPKVDSIRKALSKLYQSLKEEINKQK